MRIIHCADLHLDAKMTANLTIEQARERKAEILNTFLRMVDYAIEQHVDVIMIAGDLFDTSKISANVRNSVRDAIILHPQVDFLYLKGNHDQDNFLSDWDDIPKNLKLFSKEGTSYRYGSIVISGIELEYTGQTQLLPSFGLKEEDYNIVMLHGQESGYESKSQEVVIALNKWKNHNVDYLALGHIHTYKMKQLDNRGYYCYPGCLEGRGFDECGPKGFVLLEINDDTHEMQHTFVPFATRTLRSVEVDISECTGVQEIIQCIEAAIIDENIDARNLVKFILTGKVDAASEMNESYLEHCLRNRFYFVKVQNHTEYAIDYEDYKRDISLKGEFIRQVEASNLSEELKSQMIHCGILALSGEEL